MPRVLAAASALLALSLALGALPALARNQGRPATVPRLTAPRSYPGWIVGADSSAIPKTELPPDEPASYIVVLDDAPLASYSGGLPGLAATSPTASGDGRLDVGSAAARRYLAHLAAQQGALLSRLGAELGRAPAPSYTYRYTLNGVALRLSPAEAATAERLPGVLMVRRAEPRARASDTGPALIGAAQADLRPAIFLAELRTPGLGSGEASGRAILTYNAARRRLGVRLDYMGLSGPVVAARLVTAAEQGPGADLDLAPLAAPGGGLYAGEITPSATIERALLDGALMAVVYTEAAPGGEISGELRPARGEGVVAGVFDGGITADHPSFADRGADGYDHTNPRGPGSYLGVCAPGPAFSPLFPCNDKLIGAYTFPATAGAPDPAGRPSPFDDDGHGTHTASTFGGNLVGRSSVGGTETGPLAGVAPHVNLIAYDVCGTGAGSTCPLEAIVAAVDRAAADGVQVANFSISGFPSDPWSDIDALALLGALDAGVLTAVSAGNSGPTAGTLGAPGNAPWVMAVGASTHSRRYVRTLGDLSGGEQPPSPLVGLGIGPEAVPPTRIVDGADLSDQAGRPNPYCVPFDGRLWLDGAIVVCRQLLTAASIAANVADTGASGVVIIWPARVGEQIALAPLPIPAVHLDSAAGARLLAWLEAGSGHMASISPASRDLAGRADSVAWFSARGPNRYAPDLLKPDLVAPGVNILAASTSASPQNPGFAFLSGTSMAAPHVAGAAAILRQLHPDWTPSEMRSALMTTATPALTTADGAAPATPHDIGSGRVRVDLAARAGLLLDESAARFREANPARGGDPAQLNLPSLSSGACLERCVFTRTLRSALPAPATWTASTSGETGLRLEIQPARFTLAPGAFQTLVITARIDQSGYAAPGSYRFGAVTLVEEGGLAPPARLPVALDAPSAILPPRIEIRATEAAGTAGTVTLRTISTANLTLRVLGPSRPEQRQLRLRQDPTPGDPLDGLEGVSITVLEIPGGTPRVYLATQSVGVADFDLFVFADGEGGPADGAAQADELVCLSSGFTASEACDLALDGGAARRLIAVVQNYMGSGQGEDLVELLINVVPPDERGTLRAQGPREVRAGEEFSAELVWDLPEGPVGAGRYMGALQLSSSPDPTDAGDLGVIPLDLIYMPNRTYMPLLHR